jgi:hypothetical protein
MLRMAAKHVTVRVDPAVRSAVQQLQYRLIAEAGRPLSMGDVILAAVAVAEAHTAEAVEALTSD